MGARSLERQRFRSAERRACISHGTGRSVTSSGCCVPWNEGCEPGSSGVTTRPDLTSSRHAKDSCWVERGGNSGVPIALRQDTYWPEVRGGAWGVGYATEALRAMIDVAQQLEVRELYAICHAEHTASQQVLAKCGFSCRERLAVGFPNLPVGDFRLALRYEWVFSRSRRRTVGQSRSARFTGGIPESGRSDRGADRTRWVPGRSALSRQSTGRQRSRSRGSWGECRASLGDVEP